MTDVIIPDGVMSMADFIAEMEREPFQLIEGRKVFMPPSVAGQGVLRGSLGADFYEFAGKNSTGEVFIRLPYVLEQSPGWVIESRKPDLLFVVSDRFTQYMLDEPEWSEKPLVLVPDWVIEITGAGVTYKEMAAKVDLYLRDGVSLIWVIDRWAKSLISYTPDAAPRFFTGDATITGAPVLPEFSFQLPKLFA